MNPATLLKNESLPLNILFGPFSGAKLFMNPQSSKRHIFGIYESCLNPWLKAVIPQVSVVFDVGANGLNHRFGHSGRTACLISKVSSMRDRALRHLVQMNYSVNG